MRFAALALCLVSPAALGDTSVPEARSAAATCRDADWPALRRAVARYCDSLGDEEREQTDCAEVRAAMAGCPDHWLFAHDGEIFLQIGGKCYGDSVEFKRSLRRWTVIALYASAEDPC